MATIVCPVVIAVSTRRYPPLHLGRQDALHRLAWSHLCCWAFGGSPGRRVFVCALPALPARGSHEALVSASTGLPCSILLRVPHPLGPRTRHELLGVVYSMSGRSQASGASHGESRAGHQTTVVCWFRGQAEGRSRSATPAPLLSFRLGDQAKIRAPSFSPS